MLEGSTANVSEVRGLILIEVYVTVVYFYIRGSCASCPYGNLCVFEEGTGGLSRLRPFCTWGSQNFVTRLRLPNL